VAFQSPPVNAAGRTLLAELSPWLQRLGNAIQRRLDAIQFDLRTLIPFQPAIRRVAKIIE
jgi:hypothetical protein